MFFVLYTFSRCGSAIQGEQIKNPTINIHSIHFDFGNLQIGSLCMDMIDYELKRYETMQNDLENRRNPDANGRPKSEGEKARDQSKSAEFLDTIMNEEKPRDVCNLINQCSMDNCSVHKF